MKKLPGLVLTCLLVSACQSGEAVDRGDTYASLFSTATPDSTGLRLIVQVPQDTVIRMDSLRIAFWVSNGGEPRLFNNQPDFYEYTVTGPHGHEVEWTDQSLQVYSPYYTSMLPTGGLIGRVVTLRRPASPDGGRSPSPGVYRIQVRYSGPPHPEGVPEDSGYVPVQLESSAAIVFAPERGQGSEAVSQARTMLNRYLPVGTSHKRAVAVLDSLGIEHSAFDEQERIIRAIVRETSRSALVYASVAIELHFDYAGKLQYHNVEKVFTGP